MGTGGCGSTFLWHMLRNCGLETTGHREWIRTGGIKKAEDPARFPAPKVIKHLGGFLLHLNQHIENYQWDVEHIFFAISTLDLAMDTCKVRCVRKPFDYESELQRYYSKLGKGLSQLVDSDYPFTIIQCPTFILDADYCYNKLSVVLPDITRGEFVAKHEAFINPERRDALLRRYPDSLVPTQT
jgi:hypothetical protein